MTLRQKQEARRWSASSSSSSSATATATGATASTAAAATAAAASARTIAAAIGNTDSKYAMSPSLTRRLWRRYSESVLRRPLLTKAATAAAIFFVSDTAAQYVVRDVGEEDGVESEEFVWDGSRALSGSAFGIVATAWLHYWWNLLEVVAEARVPVARYRLANAAVKVLIDQSVGAPMYVYTYYAVTNFLRRLADETDPTAGDTTARAWKDTNAKAREMLWPTMARHWTVWPLVHSLNFYFVPLHHRVLVQNAALVGWSGYLSYLNNNAAAALVKKEQHKNRLTTPDEEAKVATLIRKATERGKRAREAAEENRAAAVASA